VTRRDDRVSFGDPVVTRQTGGFLSARFEDQQRSCTNRCRSTKDTPPGTFASSIE
jgi:hypothetical protein